MSSKRGMAWGKVAAAVAALAGVGSAQALDAGLTGLWYNPAQSGHGFEVTVIDADSASVAWYTYNKSGDPIWVSALLDETAPGVLSGNAGYIEGIKFGEFTSGNRELLPWGTLKLTFTDCETGSVDYNGTLVLDDGTGFGAGTLPLKKLAGVAGASCNGTLAAAAGTYSTFMRLTNPARQRGGFILLEPNGTATISVPGFAGYYGTYTATGNNVAYNVQAVTVPGVKFANNATTAAFTVAASGRPHDYFTGTFTGTVESGTLTSSYIGGSSRTPTLTAVAGSYNDPGTPSGVTATITTAGALTGARAGGCNFNGTMTPIGAGVNAFNVTVNFTTCGSENGAYTGKAMVVDWNDYGDNRGLAFVLRGTNSSLAVTLRRQ
jgi:hypothetical protein